MPLADISSVVCLVSCQPEQAFHPPVKGNQLLNYNRPLQTALPDNLSQDGISVLVEKSKFRLTVFHKLEPVKSYPVVFGSSPAGDKLHEGDRKTPEGIYYIRDLYPHSSWSKFIWIDYPRPDSWREHFQAKLSGRIGWLLPIGGQIGIHGVPAGEDSMIEQRVNWTWGCISLKNQDVDEVYRFVSNGTLVEVVP
ncbi:L,D-transpeptidase family protein [Leptolyngbya ectocarpi]|nr:L,D-transpeptidase [Leptolyngbya ectocarpi]